MRNYTNEKEKISIKSLTLRDLDKICCLVDVDDGVEVILKKDYYFEDFSIKTIVHSQKDLKEKLKKVYRKCDGVKLGFF